MDGEIFAMDDTLARWRDILAGVYPATSVEHQRRTP